MSMIERDWVAAFRAAATDTTYPEHPIGKAKGDKPAKVVRRARIEWLTLPGGRGRPVLMSPAHGHVLAAFRVHSQFQDLDADFITSTASANQLSDICGWSVSQVEQIVSDLKQVGFITTKRRVNRSNLTTIYRSPGNYGDSDRCLDTVESADEFDRDQAEKAKGVAPKPKPQSDPSRMLDSAKIERLAKTIQAAIEPYNKGVTKVDEWCNAIGQAQTLEDMQSFEFIAGFGTGNQASVAALIAGVLPESLQCVDAPDFGLAILPPLAIFASRVLTKLVGKPIKYLPQKSAISDRKDLSLVLWQSLVWPKHRKNSLIDHLMKADNSNPAGYLAKVLPDLCVEFDAFWASHREGKTKKMEADLPVKSAKAHPDDDDLLPLKRDEDPDDVAERMLEEREALAYADPA